MRQTATALALLASLALAACGGSTSSSSSTDQASAAPAAAASAAAANSDAAAGATGDIPDYPGAAKSTSGTQGGASGTVETTADPVAKVAAFYKDKLGATAKETDLKTPMGATSVFTMGDMASGNYSTVTVSTVAGKTTIAIAHVKK